MRYVTTRREWKDTGNNTVIKIYKEKRLDLFDVLMTACAIIVFTATVYLIGYCNGSAEAEKNIKRPLTVAAISGHQGKELKRIYH